MLLVEFCGLTLYKYFGVRYRVTDRYGTYQTVIVPNPILCRIG